MDMSKFEKIDGEKALILLAEGQKIFTAKGEACYIDKQTKNVMMNWGVYTEGVDVSLEDVFRIQWYIPKPFDVRQAMRERPNEWVGAYYDDELEQIEQPWLKVGFDPERVMVVKAHHTFRGKPSRVISPADQLHHYTPSPKDLNKCIPIEDVPEEGTIYGMKTSVAICDEETTQ
ncbi:conserved hypothetical protein [Exiguobacterium sp. 8H]|uniref:hypothetical protein n=1 Tax=unclassified Exiguobacterium TaxID=2644629 RepID=UPI0012EFD06B|nr:MULTISPECIES: hypothetical protein [unclassified Exiguobacterium]VXB52226.1 conserved hypothetical protein [Exiguobacterium sp. 8A]VXB52920.1 conserved hypothetical protein [Exiguobacterium sp. 8H]